MFHVKLWHARHCAAIICLTQTYFALIALIFNNLAQFRFKQKYPWKQARVKHYILKRIVLKNKHYRRFI